MDGWLHEYLTLPDGVVASVATVITALGTFWMGVAILLVMLGRRREQLLVAVTALVITRVVVSWLKQWIDRDRPPEIDRLVHVVGQAMPSGHAANAACIAVSIGVAWPQLRRPAILVAFGIGATRVLLGVHWASDVVVGWVVGLVISSMCALSASRVSKRFQLRLLPADSGSSTVDTVRGVTPPSKATLLGEMRPQN